MRKCPVKDCFRHVSAFSFVCWWHWQRLPQHVKDHLSAARNRYHDDLISFSELQSVVSGVVANIQGTDLDQVADAPAVTPPGTCWCGKPVLYPHDRNQSVLMLEVDPAGEYVIIGGHAETATGAAAAYTRFGRHQCVRTGPETVYAELKTGPGYQPRSTYVGTKQ
jgi:hypothetical protein